MIIDVIRISLSTSDQGLFEKLFDYLFNKFTYIKRTEILFLLVCLKYKFVHHGWICETAEIGY